MEATELSGHAPTDLIHDRDSKFTAEFDMILKSASIEVTKLPPLSPNLNAFVERFNLTIQSECLDHFFVVGERHLNHIIREFVAHYHSERPHQGLGNVLLTSAAVASPAPSGPGKLRIRCKKRLGGLLKHNARAA